MAGSGKKSPRKGKGKRKGKKEKTNLNDVLHNVDKAFYEIQIVDLNRKLARQRSLVIELEENVTQLESKLGKLNTDHGDIISYLKRNVADRNTEITDLQLQITTLSELNAAQQQNHEEQLKQFTEEYNNMKEQLTSQIKTYLAQLNALEDYRIHREELLQAFEETQNKLDEQEKKYKKQIYELEKKEIKNKAKLKLEIEKRLFAIAGEFQEANEIRIAATSQRIVRENIALNNEMNTLMMATRSLNEENVSMKEKYKEIMADYCILEDGHKKVVNKYSIQAGVLQELASVNLKQNITLGKYEAEVQKNAETNRKLDELLASETIYKDNIKQLKNRLNAARYSERDLQTQLSAEINFRHHLKVITEDLLLLIKSTLFKHPELQKKVEIPNEENIFTTMIEMLTYTKIDILPPSPHGTVSSVSTALSKSEHELPQMHIADRKPPIYKVNKVTYLGASFQDFLRNQKTKTESITSVVSQMEEIEMVCDSGSEEITPTTSTDEHSSSFNGVDAEPSEFTTCKTAEYKDDSIMEEVRMEEEIMEEENIEEGKMDEEKLSDNLDDNT